MATSLQYSIIGKILVDKGIISATKLQEIVINSNTDSNEISEFLVKKGIATEQEIQRAVAEFYDIEFNDHLEFNDQDNIFKDIPLTFLHKNNLVPIGYKNKTIKVAITEILNIQPLDDLKMLFPGYRLEPILTIKEEIQKIIHTHFDILKSESTDDLIEDLEESDFEILSSDISETMDIMDMANDAPIIRLVNTIIKQAVADKASDIHFEPYEKDYIVRFRLDGILHQMFTPPKKYQNAITSRMKIMSNLNIAENRLPQDGRIQLKISGKEIDIRVSIFPTQYGERIVLRILNKSDMKFDMANLGFNPKILEKFEKVITRTHGIILVTGPTGSGKSTTLYSVLVQLNQPNVNILTVEDPIEYQLHGIGQMQVKPKIDLTFAAGLRSILRQDPDIVMIGEVRDPETAEIAVQSALTGHSVFSTLHTNDAASGVTRLLDMGIEPFLIASSVNAILAQRLVRKICPKCKEPYKPSSKLLSELNIKPGQLKSGKLFKGKGCSHCLNTGYSGRVGIYELLPISPSIRKLIMANADSGQIKDLAIKEGMVALINDGIEKAIQGITTIEEVLRVS